MGLLLLLLLVPKLNREIKKAGSDGVVNLEGSKTVKKMTDTEVEMVSVKEVRLDVETEHIRIST